MELERKENNDLFKMKELIEKTGISRETIHFYISEGLLPKPYKKSRNMAWYTQEHIDRLLLIKELQEKQFLPLKAIKSILNDKKDYTFSNEQQNLIESIRNKLSKNNNTKKKNSVLLDKLVEKFNISDSDLNELKEIDLIHIFTKEGKEFVNTEDTVIIEKWVKLRELGLNQETNFSPKDLDVYKDIVSILFNQELKLFTERLSHMDDNKAWEIFNNAVPIVNEILSILHIRTINQFITEYDEKIQEVKEKNESEFGNNNNKQKIVNIMLNGKKQNWNNK